jgi:nicotinamide riboside kinase
MSERAQPVRIVVVGSCASGKSTLVAELRRRGFDAVSCAQEHSEIRTLWTRSQPDVLVLLHADLATVRARRGAHWPRAVYEVQQARLLSARDAADLVIDTAATPVHDVADLIVRLLRDRAA